MMIIEGKDSFYFSHDPEIIHIIIASIHIVGFIHGKAHNKLQHAQFACNVIIYFASKLISLKCTSWVHHSSGGSSFMFACVQLTSSSINLLSNSIVVHTSSYPFLSFSNQLSNVTSSNTPHLNWAVQNKLYQLIKLRLCLLIKLF